ncbi:DUF2184 domain-containing protein [Pseudomonas sp. 681]|uniref:DUF2184 domain-containing protein n=1 Tax=Pseudomonas fungipugnans TaxID=3024217 RepID=A0ABT6QVS5_9PSED|nr:DUF2184 domain-containing protein [Pseudomonas sp. 681]MDI2595016.1 DUF2184 domain-containing protein [Pseudomonas sp. 681]
MSNLILPRHIKRAQTRDSLQTFDARTIDSTGAFLVGELERLDQTMHGPLASVTWGRDIQLREDVSIADETSSFTNSTFASVGGTSTTGKAWIGKDSTSIASMALDIGKTPKPLTLWGMELSWTLPELASAMQLGRPVDSQKFTGLQLKHNMDVDEQVYIGDTELGETGMTNSSVVTNVSNAITGNWGTATADQILADVNDLLNSVWSASGFAVCPAELRLPPVQFSQLVSRKVSDAGNISVIEYLRINSLTNSLTGRPLNIQPLKWLTGRGASSTNRMMAYTNEKDRIRFPLVPLQRTPLEYRGIRQITTYYGRLGVVEVVYPETIGYRDGI